MKVSYGLALNLFVHGRKMYFSKWISSSNKDSCNASKNYHCLGIYPWGKFDYYENHLRNIFSALRNKLYLPGYRTQRRKIQK